MNQKREIQNTIYDIPGLINERTPWLVVIILAAIVRKYTNAVKEFVDHKLTRRYHICLKLQTGYY